MKIDGIEVIEPYPAVYIEDIDAVAIADLHLGYEGIMADSGIFVPKVQFEKEMKVIKKVLEARKPGRVIINGDLKHEFSETSYHEFREVSDFLAYLRDTVDEVLLTKGNHDNFLARVASREGVELFDELELGKYFFMHGDKLPKSMEKVKRKFLIIGHEHPAIALYDEIGVKEKIDCFLYGKNILVLPAFSPLMQGSEINVIPASELLSPVLKKYNVEELVVIGISEETGCLKFSRLREMRNKIHP